MDGAPILDPLNEAQRAAVTAPLGPVLVLAGAGSGKTRVLTHRIAWLIQAQGASPHGILAVTFTNKAAGEMRGRVEQLLGMPGSALWVGTFHGIAHRLLRMHWREASLVQGFQIIDREDQQRLVKKLLTHYRRRFRHVLVDEFQDRNAIQYAWMRLLAPPPKSSHEPAVPDGQSFVVGDDDQSIYRFRGARVENLQQFRKDYPQAQLY